jgi:hypothetical protein
MIKNNTSIVAGTKMNAGMDMQMQIIPSSGFKVNSSCVLFCGTA